MPNSILEEKMPRHILSLILAATCLTAACAKKDEAPTAAAPAKSTQRIKKPLKRGIIADPRKSRAYLHRAKVAAKKANAAVAVTNS